jgi:hypothetical protein
MGGIRQVPHTPRRQNFRSRLQRALSLSSSESEDHSPSRSATGDTTEEDLSLQEENDSDDRENNTSADGSEQETVRQQKTVFGPEKDLNIRGKTLLSRDSNTVALECLTE